MSLALKNSELLESRGFVGGKWKAGTSTFPVTNPANGEEIIRVANLGADDVREAIDAAYEAQKSWRALTAKERCAILLKWASRLLNHAERSLMAQASSSGLRKRRAASTAM